MTQVIDNTQNTMAKLQFVYSYVGATGHPIRPDFCKMRKCKTFFTGGCLRCDALERAAIPVSPEPAMDLFAPVSNS